MLIKVTGALVQQELSFLTESFAAQYNDTMNERKYKMTVKWFRCTL